MQGIINQKCESFCFFPLFSLLQGHKAAKFPLRVSAVKQAAPSEMQKSSLTSSEAGLAFPLSGLPVFDLGPLSPTNKAANAAAVAAAILCADVNSPASPEGPPRTKTRPSADARTQKHGFILSAVLHVKPLCENTLKVPANGLCICRTGIN